MVRDRFAISQIVNHVYVCKLLLFRTFIAIQFYLFWGVSVFDLISGTTLTPVSLRSNRSWLRFRKQTRIWPKNSRLWCVISLTPIWIWISYNLRGGSVYEWVLLYHDSIILLVPPMTILTDILRLLKRGVSARGSCGWWPTRSLLSGDPIPTQIHLRTSFRDVCTTYFWQWWFLLNWNRHSFGSRHNKDVCKIFKHYMWLVVLQLYISIPIPIKNMHYSY